MTHLNVPRPYRRLPTAEVDSHAVHELIAAVDNDLFGRVETDDGHVAGVLARPGLDPRADIAAVADTSGQLVAWAWVNRRSEAYVHPRHRGRGLGMALLAWMVERGRDVGSTHIVQTVPDRDHAAARLVTGAGFEPHSTAWLLGIDTVDQVNQGVDGIDIRAFRDDDARAAHDVTESAFADFQPRRKSLQEWAANTIDRAAFVPWASPVAVAGDSVVGTLIALEVPGRGEGVVEILAVDAACRHRGIARALLTWSFAAFARRGHPYCTLWTHTGTGALSLYERVGMTVQRTSTIYSKTLTARVILAGDDTAHDRVDRGGDGFA